MLALFVPFPKPSIQARYDPESYPNRMNSNLHRDQSTTTAKSNNSYNQKFLVQFHTTYLIILHQRHIVLAARSFTFQPRYQAILLSSSQFDRQQSHYLFKRMYRQKSIIELILLNQCVLQALKSLTFRMAQSTLNLFTNRILTHTTIFKLPCY